MEIKNNYELTDEQIVDILADAFEVGCGVDYYGEKPDGAYERAKKELTDRGRPEICREDILCQALKDGNTIRICKDTEDDSFSDSYICYRPVIENGKIVQRRKLIKKMTRLESVGYITLQTLTAAANRKAEEDGFDNFEDFEEEADGLDMDAIVQLAGYGEVIYG